jgi:hypothetical protein
LDSWLCHSLPNAQSRIIVKEQPSDWESFELAVALLVATIHIGYLCRFVVLHSRQIWQFLLRSPAWFCATADTTVAAIAQKVRWGCRVEVEREDVGQSLSMRELPSLHQSPPGSRLASPVAASGNNDDDDEDEDEDRDENVRRGLGVRLVRADRRADE